MRIVINVPESFKDDEIIINLNREEPLPFSDGVTPEDIPPDLTEKEIARINATADYYMRSMSSEVEVLEEDDDDDYTNGDFGGDIEIG